MKKRSAIYFLIISLLLLASCDKRGEPRPLEILSYEISEYPHLISGPTLLNASLSPDSNVVSVSGVISEPVNAYGVGVYRVDGNEKIENLSHILFSPSDMFTIDVELECSLDSMQLYPQIILADTVSKSDIRYKYDSEISAENYVAVRETLLQKSEPVLTDIGIPFFEFRQSAGAMDKSDFIIELESVTPGENDYRQPYLTFRYSIVNAGMRAGIPDNLAIWTSIDMVPTTHSSTEILFSEFSICILPGSSLTRETRIYSEKLSGSAYVGVNVGDTGDESDHTNNISNGIFWSR